MPHFELSASHASASRGSASRLARAARSVGAPTAADVPVRVLIIPGLHDSGPEHWQTWLQAQYADAVRVEQDDWYAADLDRWAERIGATVAGQAAARWIAVAHSFGCLALARYLKLGGGSIASALLVAPADPKKFGVVDRLPLQPLSVRSTLIGSQSDPWTALSGAHAWALLWGARFIDQGDVGHINVDSGFGPFPAARQHVDRMIGAQSPPRHSLSRARLGFSFAI